MSNNSKKDLVDYNFNYNHILRFMLIHKNSNITNSYIVPKIDKIILYFCLNYIENLDEAFIYNYFYLFRYFFGRRAFFTKSKVLFSLRKYYYTFDIKVLFTKKEVFFPIAVFLNEFQNILLPEYVGYFSYSPLSSTFVIRLFDLTLFMEKKTNLGLFNLSHCLNFKFFIVGGSFFNHISLLKAFKLNF